MKFKGKEIKVVLSFDYWRLIYTVQSNEVEIIDFVLNIVDHKNYDKIFGYKGR